MAEEFVGRGWSYPLVPSATGGIGLVGGDQELEQAIRLVLGTSVGERPFRPEFGSHLADFVFSPIDASTGGRVAYEVRRALERWEPRIDVIGVDVTVDPARPTTLYIDVRYRRKGTNDPRNLVFPFYVIPEED